MLIQRRLETGLKLIARSFIPKKYHHWLQHMYFRLRSMVYLGNRRICPCCNGHYRKFLHYGVKPRPNAQCPRCGLLERHRLTWLYLKNKTNLFSDTLRLLHFAPEYAFQRSFASLSNLDYISADLASRLAMVKVDIMDIPFRDDSFNVILCSHVLEHVTDDQKAMRELFRILMPGGWAIIQSPVDRERNETFEDATVISSQDRLRLFGQNNHLRVYGRDYKDRLEKAGFSVKIDSYIRSLDSDVIEVYGLDEDMVVYFCTK